MPKVQVWGVLLAAAVAAATVLLYVYVIQSEPRAHALDPNADASQLEVAQGRPPLPPEQYAALRALIQDDPAGTTRPDPMLMMHMGTTTPAPLSAAQQAQFDAQLAAASAAVAGLDTTQEAAAAGYVQSTRELGGIGTHWVNWQLIGKPFDPARPAMLLYATVSGHEHLVAYSYFVESEQAPAGFAGPNDEWHQHGSLCILNGWLVSEGQPKAACTEGDWLHANKLWMVHAWVVPGFANPWGLFAEMNPSVCPDSIDCEDFKKDMEMPDMPSMHHL